MTQRISGKDVEVRLSTGVRVLFDNTSLSLEDGITGTTDQGYPSGWVGGEVKGEGEIVVATETLLALNKEADLAGSWEEMPEFDMSFYAKVGSIEMEIRAFGVKLKFPGFDFDGKGGDKATHTIAFIIGSPDFVHINGVPLAKRPGGAVIA